MNKKIVVIGSSNTDMIIKVPRIPKPGETILGGTFTTAAGGKGANQAVAAARAGAEVCFIACVGQDSFGDAALQGFQVDGINTQWITRHPSAPSGIAQILVSAEGENSIAVAPGANAVLTPEQVHNAESEITAASCVLIQLEIPIETVEAAINLAYKNQVPIILNPAPAQPLSDDLLSKISILTPNESETELLTGQPIDNEDQLHQAATTLLNKGIKTLIITLGEKGAFVATSKTRYHVPGFSVRAVDTTAAGDVFNGALAAALCQEQDLKTVVSFANAAAALSVTKMGAQPSAPTLADIQKMLNA